MYLPCHHLNEVAMIAAMNSIRQSLRIGIRFVCCGVRTGSILGFEILNSAFGHTKKGGSWFCLCLLFNDASRRRPNGRCLAEVSGDVANVLHVDLSVVVKVASEYPSRVDWRTIVRAEALCGCADVLHVNFSVVVNVAWQQVACRLHRSVELRVWGVVPLPQVVEVVALAKEVIVPTDNPVAFKVTAHRLRNGNALAVFNG